MNNPRKILFSLTLLSLLAISFSCKNDDPVSQDSTQATNEDINSWILDNMQTYYLWTDQIPASTDKSLNPGDYFNSLLYKPEDRFSWIQENYTDLLNYLSGVVMEAGYDYSLGQKDSTDVLGIVTYIKPNSPASITDLKRGDYFNTINGTKLTMDNYSSLLNGLSSPHTLGIVDFDLNPIENISMSVIQYAEDPVLLDTVYTMAGKKIGYLVYNFFAEDNGDNTNAYANELNTIFGQFKATGINELILDLRYNSGGSLTSCAELSSMISNRSKSDIFCLMQYNSILDQALKKQEGADYNKIYFADNIGTVKINKLTNLNRLFVITSGRTASASEDLINGLKAYMNVILIGTVTYGKNVGSTTIYEKDPVKQKTNKWGMQPIIVKCANANGNSDFGNGFAPDAGISEYQNLPLEPLGDTNEPVLSVVLSQMGVVSGTASLRANKENTVTSVYSSVDRTPVRRNATISLTK